MVTIDQQIEIVDKELSVWRVELEEWIIAKCRIEQRIEELKWRIESYQEYFTVLKEERGSR